MSLLFGPKARAFDLVPEPRAAILRYAPNLPSLEDAEVNATLEGCQRLMPDWWGLCMRSHS